MVTQKAISARIDKKLLEELDLEVSIGTGNRNKIINDAIRFYIDYLDTMRRMTVMTNQNEQYATRVEFNYRWFVRKR